MNDLTTFSTELNDVELMAITVPDVGTIPSSVHEAAPFSEQMAYFSGDRRRGGKKYYLFAKGCRLM
jgi:hypothetical protein